MQNAVSAGVRYSFRLTRKILEHSMLSHLIAASFAIKKFSSFRSECTLMCRLLLGLTLPFRQSEGIRQLRLIDQLVALVD